ncbi:MAG TPA: GNAT family N-acetyltransferase [Candidatus Polarisedimenticolaceae bacterium]|nr:GNAT family N-acetyltransferase [Candidatus Polarisedimenticolaceae bacterium]
MDVELRPEDLGGPAATTLIAALNAELKARYPEEGATHFRLDPQEVSPGSGAFFVAYSAQTPIGCGAVRRLDPATAEIKRMYVVPEMRGRGVSKAILAGLEAEARRLGVRRLVLETGLRQQEAMALYRRHGFVEIPPFGEYVGSRMSVCLGKTL